jgi:hypothetical protein
VPQDGLRLAEVPEDMAVALQRGGAFEGLQGISVVAACHVGVPHGMVGEEIRGISGEGARAHGQALGVVAGLLEEEARHGLELHVVGTGGEAPAGDLQAPAVITLGDAHEAEQPHAHPVRRILRGYLFQARLSGGRVAPLHGVDGLHVQALALVARIVRQRHDLKVRLAGEAGLARAPGHIGPGAVAQDEMRIGRHRGLQGIGRPVAPAEKEVDPPLVRRQRVRRRGGYGKTPEIGVCHETGSHSPML